MNLIRLCLIIFFSTIMIPQELVAMERFWALFGVKASTNDSSLNNINTNINTSIEPKIEECIEPYKYRDPGIALVDTLKIKLDFYKNLGINNLVREIINTYDAIKKQKNKPSDYYTILSHFSNILSYIEICNISPESKVPFIRGLIVAIIFNIGSGKNVQEVIKNLGKDKNSLNEFEQLRWSCAQKIIYDNLVTNMGKHADYMKKNHASLGSHKNIILYQIEEIDELVKDMSNPLINKLKQLHEKPLTDGLQKLKCKDIALYDKAVHIERLIYLLPIMQKDIFGGLNFVINNAFYDIGFIINR